MATPNPKKLLKDAALAYRDGDKAKAQEILLQLVGIDEKNEKAWLLLSAVVESLEDRQIALENALTINPKNEKARRGLELVEKKLAENRQRTEQASTGWADIDTGQLPEAPAAGTDPWGRYLEEDSSGASLQEEPVPASSQPAFDAPTSDPFTANEAEPADDEESAPGWGNLSFEDLASRQPGAEEPAEDIATSMDWSDDSSAAFHGSGQQVDQPSADEYDSWIDNLNLKNGEDEATTQAPDDDWEGSWGDVDPSELFESTDDAEPDGASPWGDASGTAWDDTEADAPASDAASPFGDFDWDAAQESDDAWQNPAAGGRPEETGWGDIDTASGTGEATSRRIAGQSPFGDASLDEGPAELDDEPVPVEDTGPRWTTSDSPFVGGVDPFASEPDVVETPADPVPPPSAAADEPEHSAEARPPIASAQSSKKHGRSRAAYFKVIPPEIEPARAWWQGKMLLASVAGLAVLNVVAVIVIISQLV